VVKNTIGKNSGKVLVTYSTQDAAEQCITHFNNRAVDNLVCQVSPYFEKDGFQRSRNQRSILERRVYLMNVPYDATLKELENLVKPHAPDGIEDVQVARDKNGLARGFAFVFVNNPKDVKRVIEYVDGRYIRNRQIR
jgi:RNA recognition motif-containing protein